MHFKMISINIKNSSVQKAFLQKVQSCDVMEVTRFFLPYCHNIRVKRKRKTSPKRKEMSGRISIHRLDGGRCECELAVDCKKREEFTQNQMIGEVMAKF